VAAFERLRDGYDVNGTDQKHGPGAGIHKTVDGGKTFKKITKGCRRPHWTYRSRLACQRPEILYAIIDTEKGGSGPPNPRGGGNAISASPAKTLR